MKGFVKKMSKDTQTKDPIMPLGSTKNVVKVNVRTKILMGNLKVLIGKELHFV